MATGRFSWPVRDFMGVPLAACTTSDFISQLIGNARAADPSNPLFASYINAACSNIAAHDEQYADILRQADAVYADGQAIVWASRWLRQPIPERVNAADFILDFCRAATKAGVSLYLIGSRDGVAAEASERFRAEAPGLDLRGAESGYFTDGGAEATARIRAAQPDILLVGMGVPLQEKWAWANRERFGARAIWCVGAMFEYFGRERARAPVWVRKAGLEWLFRLVLEPCRLWRRYLIGNWVFLLRVLRSSRK